MNAPLCICNGMVRSGSTWSFNVCRELYCESADKPKTPALSSYINCESLEELTSRLLPELVVPVVVKAHILGASAFKAILGGRARAVYTFRDPRDCVASDLIFLAHSFEQSVTRVKGTLLSFDFHRSTPGSLLVRYEEMMADPRQQIRRIASHLGATVDDEAIDRIESKTNLQSCEIVCQSLKHRSADQLIEVESHRVDPDTQLHENHLQGGTIGRWEKELSSAQIADLNQQFGPWLIKLGYS